MERFFIHNTKHPPGLGMYLLKQGCGLDGVQQSLPFGGWMGLCCGFCSDGDSFLIILSLAAQVPSPRLFVSISNEENLIMTGGSYRYGLVAQMR